MIDRAPLLTRAPCKPNLVLHASSYILTTPIDYVPRPR